MSVTATYRVAIRTKRSAAEFSAITGERLLFAGLRNGFNLPYDCASGSCGSCQAELSNSEKSAIENAFPNAPASKSLASGRILMCQSICRGEIELRVFSTIAPLPGTEIRPDHFDGRIDSISELAPNTFRFSVRTQQPVGYLPGQFVMISAESVPGYRAYSMTTAEQNDGVLDFVIKTTPSGAFSRWLRQTARPNAEVRLFGPLGRAILRSNDESDLVAIAGGTGIAGIIAIIEGAIVSGYIGRHRATVIFGVRSLGEAFFLDRLSDCVERARGGLQVIVALAEPNETVPGGLHKNMAFRHGLVIDVARDALGGRKGLLEACFFVAGPPAVVDAGMQLLCGTWGVSPRSVRFDRFH